MIDSGELIDGRYRIQEHIGSGGMADVYLAYDLELQRDVAIKVLASHLADDPEFQERLWREAENAAALRHPNIVAIYDRGMWNGRPYISMEYVPGLSLKGQIRTHTGADIHWAVTVIIQILKAVDCAHSYGVIHRDLKPHNVLLDTDGCVKVTDFGIARAGASEITQAGSILGSAQYLAPEQAQGQTLTTATDLYAVGVILYELLTQELPFDGDNPVAIAMQHVARQPAVPSSRNEMISAELDAVVLKALAKDPAQRFHSADQFIAALCAATGLQDDGVLSTSFPTGESNLQPAKAVGRRPWWLLWAIAGGSACIAVIIIAIVLSATHDRKVIVPNITGASSAAALARLDNEGFDTEIRRVGSTLSRDTVIRQSPLPGQEVSAGVKVVLTVSEGPGTKAVPGFARKREQDAVRALKTAGFQPVVRRQTDENVRAGFVIGTQPPVASQIQIGGEVIVLVSTGPALVEVPNLVGLSQVDAETRLRKAGLVPEVTERLATSATGSALGVIEQDPPAGKRVRKATTVAFVVVTANQQANTIQLPSVIGESVDQAKALLIGLGLKVRVVPMKVDRASRDGIVQQQQPSAGAVVEDGSVVVLTVGAYGG